MTEARVVEVEIVAGGRKTKEAARELDVNYSTFRRIMAKIRKSELPGMVLKPYDAIRPFEFEVIKEIFEEKYQKGYLWKTAIENVRDRLWQ